MHKARMQDDQPRLLGVGDVRVVLGTHMHPSKPTPHLALIGEPTQDLGPHVLAVQPLGLVLGRARDVRLDVIPILALARIEVGRPIPERRQRRVEVARHITRHGRPEEDPLRPNALVGRARRDRRGRPEEDRPRQPLRQRPLAEQRLLLIDPHRLGVRPVDVGVDDRLPRVR